MVKDGRRLAVTYTADVDGQDRQVYEAADDGGEVRLRAALTLYKDQQYQAWPGQSWVARGDAEQVLGVRDALKAFFSALERKSPTQVAQLLELA